MNKRSLGDNAGKKLLADVTRQKNLLKDKIKHLKKTNLELWSELLVEIVDMDHNQLKTTLRNMKQGMDVVEAIESL
jgi:phosphopantetheine adenylyltransferase